MRSAVQNQQDQIDQIQQRLAPLSKDLAHVAAIEDEVQAANIEENDHTVYTYQDLDFELRLVEQTVVKKIKFIENQVSGLHTIATGECKTSVTV
jgi:hypothetical protein